MTKMANRAAVAIIVLLICICIIWLTHQNRLPHQHRLPHNFNSQRSQNVSKDCLTKLSLRRVPNGSNPEQLLSYKYLYNEVYNSYGFECDPQCITEPWLSLLPVKQKEQDFCRNVFREWMLANDKEAPNPPPKEIPTKWIEEYMLKGTVAYNNWYLNTHSGTNVYNWTRVVVDDLTSRALKNENFGDYKEETQIVLKSAASVPMTGFSAAVIGSLRPWVEAILLINNVSSILTMEYGKIVSEDPRLSYMHPIEMGQLYLNDSMKIPKFDLVVTYSSLEHAGLGRYGDVMDPWGDVREMQKSWCMLKPGGIMMFGLPENTDQVVFNAHRIYGPVRLPLMTAGFEVTSIYGMNGPLDLAKFTGDDWPMRGMSQRMIVMRKRG